jgi:ATP-dependent RNA helicase RhlB
MPATHAAPHPAPVADDGQAPRKRRRRRGGRRTGGDEVAIQGQGGAANAARQSAREQGAGKRDAEKRGSARHSPPKGPHGAEAGGSLLTRIGRGLRSLVTRAPRSQH